MLGPPLLDSGGFLNSLLAPTWRCVEPSDVFVPDICAGELDLTIRTIKGPFPRIYKVIC